MEAGEAAGQRESSWEGQHIFREPASTNNTNEREGIWKIKLPDGLEILTIQRNQGQLLHGKNDPFSLNPAMKLIEQVTIFFSIILSSLDYRIRWGKVSKAGNSRGWVGRSSKEGQSSKKGDK